MCKYIRRTIGYSGLVLLVAILYIGLGGMAPFLVTKTISEKTKKDTTVLNKVYQNKKSVDRAMLLETNLSAWEQRIRLLLCAKERIILSTFDMREGKSTTDLAAILYQKAEEGVQVSLFVDGMNGRVRMHENDFFYALSTHPNIEVRFYNPLRPWTPWKTQGRMHDKYVVVDDIGYILGGRNTFDYFIGDYPARNRSYDREVLIYNTAHGTEDRTSSLYEVESYFEQMWDSKDGKTFGKKEGLVERETVVAQVKNLKEHYVRLQEEWAKLFEPYDYEKATVETKSVTLLSGDTGIYGKEPKVLYQLELLMEQAKKRVLLHTPYIVADSYMYGVLERVASRVPQTRVMINSVENGDNFFASSDYQLHKGRVLETGISLYEYNGGTSYHGKSVVIDDDLAIIGSYNYDLRSTYVNTELMVVVRSEELAQELAANFEALEKDASQIISKEESITPSHIKIETVPFMKRAAMKVVGILLQPFRKLL